MVAQNLVQVDSRVIALSTSEDALWAHLNRADRRRIRGEEVRMINVRACVSDIEDIFDGPKASEIVGRTVEQRRDFVVELERHARKYQGEAFRAYLTKRAADKRATATLQSLHGGIHRRRAPAQPTAVARSNSAAIRRDLCRCCAGD